MNRTKRVSVIVTKILVDLAAFAGFLVAFDPRTTGIAIHEWLTIAGTAAIVIHLLLNWNWITGITKKLFRKVTPKVRLNYILNWLLFIDGVALMLSGLMISRVALPAIGIQLAQSFSWRGIHSASADLSLVILAVHLGLNWDWVVGMVKRFIAQPISRLSTKKQNASNQGEVQL